MTRTQATLLMLAVVLATIGIAYLTGDRTPHQPVDPTTRPTTPAYVRLGDCTTHTAPCVTGHTLHPATGTPTTLPLCTTEDSGPTMPCLFINADPTGSPYVINYR